MQTEHLDRILRSVRSRHKEPEAQLNLQTSNSNNRFIYAERVGNQSDFPYSDENDAEDTTKGQRVYITSLTQKVADAYDVIEVPHHETTAVDFSIGSGVRKQYATSTEDDSSKMPETRQGTLNSYDIALLLEEKIGEAALKSGRRLPPEEDERLNDEISCNPQARVILDYMKCRGRIPSQDFEISRYN